MEPSTYNNFTDGEHLSLEAFRLAGPAQRELMLQTYVAFRKNIEDEGIREYCGKIIEKM